jgi:hypothetical protein
VTRTKRARSTPINGFFCKVVDIGTYSRATYLAVFSVGIFMAPLVIIGWIVFALRSPRAASERPTGSPAGVADLGDYH